MPHPPPDCSIAGLFKTFFKQKKMAGFFYNPAIFNNIK